MNLSLTHSCTTTVAFYGHRPRRRLSSSYSAHIPAEPILSRTRTTTRTITTWLRSRFPACLLLPLAVALCAGLAGCFSPHTLPTRHFVLNALPPADSAPSRDVRLGVRVGAMPEYLLSTSIAVRQSAHEIRYLETALWAHRLDKGFERVLAANLSTLVPANHVRLGAWRAEDVTLEVHVTVELFDVDKDGKGTLVAWWRLTTPGGTRTLDSGVARLSKAGKPLEGDPQNIVTTLSELTADFSRQLAGAVQNTPAR